MKKAVSLLMVLGLILNLCGCGFSSVFVSANRERLVSAIGFSNSKNKAEVYIETITVNSENPQADSTVSVIKGEGETVKEAMENAVKKSTLELRLSHCTAAVISSDSNSDFLSEVFEFIYNTDQINLSVSVICALNVEEFLNQKPNSTITVGFWVAESLSAQGKKTGFRLKNKFYEIEAMRRGEEKAYTLPQFSKIDEGIVAFLEYENDRKIMEKEAEYGE